jgi:spore maturation protein CgeB
MSSPFHLALFGSSLVSAYWNGAATYDRGIVRALVARGGEAVAAHLDELPAARVRAIGRAARAWMLARHTYAHRAAQVETILTAHRKTAEAVLR